MPRRVISTMLLLAICVGLCGCGAMFETEYVSVSEYIPAVQKAEQDGKVNVKNFTALKQAIRQLVLAGEKEGKITVDAAYDGDVVEDLASACWELRTEDPLCAYCIENIAYDTAKIVNYYEVDMYFSYSRADVGSIVSTQYLSGAEKAIIDALESGQNKLVLLINRSNYTADNMISIISDIYRERPASAPKMPNIEVNLFSGTGIQRLYEIKLSYGMLSSEFSKRKEALELVEPFIEVDTESISEPDRAYMACSYLMENCVYTSDAEKNNIYSALVENEANSEGMAYAYVELCRQLGIECQMIYGQRKWQEHCWNIVKLGGEYYHVDISICSTAGPEASFMMRDMEMWNEYRWDVSSYPECNGELRYNHEGTINPR